MDEGDEYKFKALIVDDEKAIRDILAAQIRELGFDSTFAEGQDQAISIINRGEEFDLCIFDLRLRQGDGVTLISQLRNIKGNEDTPVLLISGLYSHRDLIDICDKFHLVDVLPKPFKQAGLVGAIHNLLKKASISREEKIRAESCDNHLVEGLGENL
ncbi:MAG: response regulator [Planctomycetes bacterium]|nr:response regulator [Planctomycetota bacterium]